MSTFVWDSCQLTFDGIQYNENHDAYSIQINREGTSTAVRKITCAWGDAIALANSLKGNTVEVGGSLVYTEAASHPVLPNLKVSGIQIQPVGKPITTGIWEQAFLTVAYDIPEFGGGGGGVEVEDLAEESLDISAFNQTETRKKLEFEGGDAVEEDITFTVRTIEYQKTLYRQASLPLLAIAALVNKVNSGVWNEFAEGRALYAGAQANRTITSEGAQEWTITHTVLVGESDLRERVNPNGGGKEIVRFKNGAGPLYATGNFASVGL